MSGIECYLSVRNGPESNGGGGRNRTSDSLDGELRFSGPFSKPTAIASLGPVAGIAPAFASYRDAILLLNETGVSLRSPAAIRDVS